jgi:hypothetical protein
MSSFLRAAARAVGWESSEHADTPEFTYKLQQYKIHMDDIQRVRDAMQLYSDALEAMMAAQLVLGEALDSYYKSSSKAMTAEERVSPPACHVVAQSFKQSMMEMYGYVRPAVHEVFVSRCVRPVTYILSRVPAFNEQLSNRKKLVVALHDVRADIQSHKVQSPALAKDEAKMSTITQELSRLDYSISAILDEYAEARPRMLAQELAVVVACSHHHSQMLGNQLSKLLPLVPQAASSMCLLQAAAATREKKLTTNSSEKELAEIVQNFVNGNEVSDILFERGKASGGRIGGYGLASVASRSESNARRASLKSVRTVSASHVNQSLMDSSELLDLVADSSDDEIFSESEQNHQSHSIPSVREHEQVQPAHAVQSNNPLVPPAKPPKNHVASLLLAGGRISSSGAAFSDFRVHEVASSLNVAPSDQIHTGENDTCK